MKILGLFARKLRPFLSRGLSLAGKEAAREIWKFFKLIFVKFLFCPRDWGARGFQNLLARALKNLWRKWARWILGISLFCEGIFVNWWKVGWGLSISHVRGRSLRAMNCHFWNRNKLQPLSLNVNLKLKITTMPRKFEGNTFYNWLRITSSRLSLSLLPLLDSLSLFLYLPL